jgi:transposase InsO family protein
MTACRTPDAISLADRLFIAGICKGALEPLAVRALNKAVHLLSLALATRIQDLRAADDPLLKAVGQIEEHAILVGLLQEIARILGERWDRILPKNRPHYTPCQRFSILRIKRLLALSPEDASHLFRISPTTISEWQTELSGHPERTEIGKTVRPSPPLRRYADVVAHTVQAMGIMGLSGYATVAAVLARAGWSVGRSSVARYLKKPQAPPQPADSGSAVPRAVRARYVHHVWMMDFTPVKGLFGLQQFAIATVLDVYSRLPLAVRVFDSEPSAAQAVGLAEAALRAHGRPRHFISDQGAQFTAEVFRENLAAHGIRQRFGAVGKHGSIGIIDRFFRTLKESLGLATWRHLHREDLERRLETALTHYAVFRPHQALSGATPAEVFFGDEPACRSAVRPPRATDANGPAAVPFRMSYLDAEQRFPIVEKIAA